MLRLTPNTADSANCDRQWIAVYTAPRHERQVTRQLAQKDVESFLPQYELVRRWKTGPTRIRVPLFPGYTFAQIELAQRRVVLEIPSVLRIVGNRLGPTPVSESEIEQLRRAVESGLAVPHPYLTVGNRVRITHGALCGTEGVLVRKKGQTKIVISIELIRQAVSVEVDACDVEACSNSSITACAA